MLTKYSQRSNRHLALLHRDWQQDLWSQEIFYTYNEDFFQAILSAIDTAQDTVILATYIFSLDDLGKQFIETLGAARRRGVEIRVLLDGVGSMENSNLLVEAMTAEDIQLRFYHPLPWQSDNGHHSLHHGSAIGNFFARLLTINQRYHAKICIVEQNKLWAGSQNISICHLSVSRGGQDWHDYGACVSGEAVVKVAQSFDDFWRYRKPKIGGGLFKHYWANISVQSRRKKNRLLKSKIKQSQQNIWIVNPYFSPSRSVLRALRKASQRGIDVRIIVPNKSDIGFFPFLTAIYYEELIKSSIRVFEYLPCILHAKLLIVDDFRLLGSTNLNHRSLFHDIEFDIVLASEQARQLSHDSFLHDQAQSREILVEDLNLYGWRWAVGKLIWLVRYWL
jgi:cardiolipin synthase